MRYKPDHKGIGEMLLGPEMHAMVNYFAQAGKAHAESIAPQGSTGEYRRSFEIETGLELNVTKRPGKRAVARLHNKADHAAAVEWRHGHAVLSRTAAFLDGWHP